MIAAGVLFGCVRTRELPDAPTETPGAFSAPGETPLPDRWWEAFDDAQLDALVRAGLRGNFGLRSIRDRLDQASALVARDEAARYPTIDASGSAARIAEREDDDTDYRSNLTLGAVASYEVDLWGGIAAEIRASRFEADARAAEVHAAAITLSAALTETWYQRAGQRARVALIEAQIGTNEDALAVLELRFRRGQSRLEDVLRQRQLVESRRGELADAWATLEVLEHRLAVLLGREPRAPLPAAEPLIELPPLPSTGVPLELLRRRPDLVAAELRIRAAHERVAVAITERYPRLTLSATAETTAETVADLFDDWQAALIAAIVGPLFDAGLRKAEVEAAEAEARELFHRYWDTVLLALGEVEDALAIERRQGERLASLRRQLELSQQVMEQARVNYRNGVTDYLGLLDARRTHQALELDVLTARLDRIVNRVSLCRALAGGWELDPREGDADGS